jgi:hypothetical protein
MQLWLGAAVAERCGPLDHRVAVWAPWAVQEAVMQTTRTCSAVTRRRLEAQGFLALEDAAIAEVGPWLRLVPALCAAWAAVGTGLGSPVVIWALMPFAALGAVRRGHPFDVIYNHGIRHLLGTRPLPPYNAPRRFACAVATLWLGATGWALYAGASVLGHTLGATLVLAALVPTLTDFCIPSFFYGLLFGKPDACARMTAVLEHQARLGDARRKDDDEETLGQPVEVAVLAPQRSVPTGGEAH